MANQKKRAKLTKHPVHLRLHPDLYKKAQFLSDEVRSDIWPEGMPLATYLVSVIEPILLEKFQELGDLRDD